MSRLNDAIDQAQHILKKAREATGQREKVNLIVQAHERRNADYKTAGQRNQDSTVRVFGAIFGSPSDGEAEPVRDAG